MAIPFVVEDGTGKANATSYTTLAYFRNYWNTRGDAVTIAWTDDRTSQNLNIATAYLDARYREQYKGRKLTKLQILCWPRIGVVIDGEGQDSFIPGLGPVVDGFIVEANEIPTILQDALCELAKRSDTNTLAPDIAPGDGFIARKKVGPIEVDYRAPFNATKVWAYVDWVLSPLLVATGISIQIVRS